MVAGNDKPEARGVDVTSPYDQRIFLENVEKFVQK